MGIRLCFSVFVMSWLNESPLHTVWGCKGYRFQVKSMIVFNRSTQSVFSNSSAKSRQFTKKFKFVVQLPFSKSEANWVHNSASTTDRRWRGSVLATTSLVPHGSTSTLHPTRVCISSTNSSGLTNLVEPAMISRDSFSITSRVTRSSE